MERWGKQCVSARIVSSIAVELVGAFPDERAEPLDLDLAPLLLVFERSHGFSYHLARRLVTPRCDAGGQELSLLRREGHTYVFSLGRLESPCLHIGCLHSEHYTATGNLMKAWQR